MTAVIYARYSSDNQREESIEGQIRECTAYAEKNGITVVKHYIDRALSAKTDNRPDFQQMIKDSEKRLFDIVLVWKLDRFARNRYDSARYKTQLKRNGVKLMSATEIISEGLEGIILESVLEGYAEYYSADLAEKVVRGQTENILKGRCNGGRGTFGYTLDSERKFHIDPLASPFVLESFRKYRDGLTMKEIRDWLNENGINVFTAEEVQRHAHRHVGVRVDTLEVHVQNLVLVRVHLEGTQDHELFSAVEFHRQDGGMELFLLQRVEHFVVIDGDHGCRLVQAIKDCGNLGFAAKAAARTRTLRCAGSGGEFHG